MYWFPWLAIPIKNIYYFHFIGFTMKWSYQVLSVLLFATLKNHLVSYFHRKPRSNCFCLLHSKWNSLISINFSVEDVFFSDHESFMEIFSPLPLVFNNTLTPAHLTWVCYHCRGLISAAFRDSIVSLVLPTQWYIKIQAVPWVFFLLTALN